MADKPSRALVLYGYGLAPLIKPCHSHLHEVASRGCCGFLALDNSSPNPEGGDEKLIRELAQLLDAREAFDRDSGQKSFDLEAPKQVLSMMERFMGMRAAIVTNNSAVKQFGDKLGFNVNSFDKLTNGQSSDFVADEMLKLLGFQDGKTLDKDHFDLLLLHVGPPEIESMQTDLEYVNSMVGRILQVAKPGSEVGSRLHLSIVMSYGNDSKDDPTLSLESLAEGNNSDLRCLFPRQSYTLKEVDLRSDIRHSCPMLVAQWQSAVTRKDTVQEFSFREFKKKSGNLAIAADRFLYEVAFKLWKAPKYGA
ncbi:uncharacterized protein LOC141653448 [Silene latifolia]|uniref:uncharacterized protein LOC141653448 n=1 Tax=Silene latifolia TaxID=37657 RepID=UPI003D76B87B